MSQVHLRKMRMGTPDHQQHVRISSFDAFTLQLLEWDVVFVGDAPDSQEARFKDDTPAPGTIPCMAVTQSLVSFSLA